MFLSIFRFLFLSIFSCCIAAGSNLLIPLEKPPAVPKALVQGGEAVVSPLGVTQGWGSPGAAGTVTLVFVTALVAFAPNRSCRRGIGAAPSLLCPWNPPRGASAVTSPCGDRGGQRRQLWPPLMSREGPAQGSCGDGAPEPDLI